ncbi:hypothetical protein FALCPG4_002657 [Fusarium falciforme]
MLCSVSQQQQKQNLGSIPSHPSHPPSHAQPPTAEQNKPTPQTRNRSHGQFPKPHFFVSSSPAECGVLKKSPQPADVSHAMPCTRSSMSSPRRRRHSGVERS